jgi:hypothetical protein
MGWCKVTIAVTQTLIVVDQVELTDPAGQVTLHAGAERGGFAEGAGEEQTQLVEVLARLQLPDGGKTKGVMVVDQIEAGQFGE